MPRRLIFLSALLVTLSFPPFDLGWLAWVALIPWLIVLARVTARQAFLYSWWLGVLFFAYTMWWVRYVTVPGVVLLVPVLALFFAAWGWCTNKVALRQAQGERNRIQFLMLFAPPAAWALLEYCRAIFLSGLPWNLLAHTQWNWLPIIQMADLTGVYGVSFLVVLVNICLFQTIRHRFRTKHSAVAIFIAVAAIFLAWGYGSAREAGINSLHGAEFKVTVVQGNIPQPEKWDDAFREAIWKRYEQVTAEAAKEKPDLIIWPETSVPGYLDDPGIGERLGTIIRNAQVPFLAGVPTGDATGEHLYNSALLFDAEGRLLERYDKIHLVPFGEYLPLTPVLGWLRNFVLMGTFTHGSRPTVFHPPSPAARFSTLICFEDLFPGLCRRFTRAGAQWFIVITNDAWFGRSAASVQHLQASVFRAVENRAWVVRAANTGWSGFVNPVGRRLSPPQQLARFKPGFATASIWPVSPDAKSLYSRWGDWFLLFCLALVGMAFFARRKPV